jgi:DNA (cytosine-5)-methyltransferase 1
MKYLDLFAGYGGFSLGIQQAYDNNLGRITSTSDTENRQHLSEPNISDGDGRRSNTSIPECIGFSEINKYASEVYQHKFPTHKPYGDITKINAKELPDFNLLVGGVPCQSWSIAGKRGGFEDERGNMWFQFSRILREKQPKYFLAENVKGLLSHDGGKSMERICEELCGCGYAIDFEVLNAKEFGVPQNRERVFIMGIRLDLLDTCQIF